MKAVIRLAPAGARSGALTCSRNNVPTCGDDAVGTMTRNGSLLVRLSYVSCTEMQPAFFVASSTAAVDRDLRGVACLRW